MILFNLAAHFHNSLHTLQTSLHNLQTRFKLLYTLPDLAAPSQTSLHTPQHRFILSNLAANPQTLKHIPTPRFTPSVQLSKLYKIIKANAPPPTSGIAPQQCEVVWYVLLGCRLVCSSRSHMCAKGPMQFELSKYYLLTYYPKYKRGSLANVHHTSTS